MNDENVCYHWTNKIYEITWTFWGICKCVFLYVHEKSKYLGNACACKRQVS